MKQSRRTFLRSAVGMGLLGSQLPGLKRTAWASSYGADALGPLQPADANGLMLPPECSSRVVAVANQKPVPSASTTWHTAPDGGATFATPGGGWVYASNCERSSGNGGVRVIEFDSTGEILDVYSILSGTSRNCAGGTTPWETWISCEEVSYGYSYECDPLSPGSSGIRRAALGRFKHEAAAVDPVTDYVYQTEDEWNGRLYRFRPDVRGDLSAGVLEAAEILDPDNNGNITVGETRPLAWHVVPNPTPSSYPGTRYQVPSATAFNRGEGIWAEGGFCYFATTGDNRVWVLDMASQTIEILYDASTSLTPELTQPDNVFVSSAGDVYVAEDAGNLEIVALTPTGAVKPIVRVTGHSSTELTGPALSPDGQRLYFSSQRAPTPTGNYGVTYEIEGPFVDLTSIEVPAIGAFGGLTLATALALAARRVFEIRETTLRSQQVGSDSEP
ncbi:PhoX family protein [Myxococcota bacterium]|nr:PhoX family protein [Myxococcota bacterium]